MEEKLIEEWLTIKNGSGNDSGSSCGEGSALGDGFCNKFSFSRGNGSGSGSGTSSGDGGGFENGEGSGSGNGIKIYNSNKVFVVDGLNTIITRIIGNYARGFILNTDFTLEKTYIVKGHNLFAHGLTLKEAMKSLQNKIFQNMDTDEKIKEFRNKFNSKDKYLGSEFFEWHNLLTGSCLQGRNNFVKNKGLNLNDKFTVHEFINLCKNDYGGQIISKLEKYYKN